MYIIVSIYISLAYKCLIQTCENIISRNYNNLKKISFLILGKLKEYKELICTDIVHVAKTVNTIVSSEILVDEDHLRNVLDGICFLVAN